MPPAGWCFLLIPTQERDPPPHQAPSLLLTRAWCVGNEQKQKYSVCREPSLGSSKKLKYHGRNLFSRVLEVARGEKTHCLGSAMLCFEMCSKLTLHQEGTWPESTCPVQPSAHVLAHPHGSPHPALPQQPRLSASTTSDERKFLSTEIKLPAQPKKHQPAPCSLPPSAHVYSEPSEKKKKKKE